MNNDRSSIKDLRNKQKEDKFFCIKRFFHTYLIMVVCIVFSSCTLIAKAFFGVKEATPISSKMVLESAEKYRIDATNVFGLTYSAYIDRLFKNGESHVHVEIFDQKGNVIVPNDTMIEKCSGRIADYLEHIGDTKFYYSSDTLRIDQYLIGLTDVEGAIFPLANIPVADYTAVVNWASHVGKLNDPVISWKKILENKRDLSITILYVNLDQRDFWGKTPLTD